MEPEATWTAFFCLESRPNLVGAGVGSGTSDFRSRSCQKKLGLRNTGYNARLERNMNSYSSSNYLFKWTVSRGQCVLSYEVLPVPDPWAGPGRYGIEFGKDVALQAGVGPASPFLWLYWMSEPGRPALGWGWVLVLVPGRALCRLVPSLLIGQIQGRPSKPLFYRKWKLKLINSSYI